MRSSFSFTACGNAGLPNNEPWEYVTEKGGMGLNDQSQGYCTPFSMAHDYRVVWRKHPNHQLDLKMLESQKSLVATLYQLRFATKVQLAKLTGRKKIKSGKKTIDLLKHRNIIVQHFLYDQKTDRVIPFYSLSTNAIEKKGFTPLEYEEIDKEYVLKRLLLAQFLSRFYELGIKASLLPFPDPFDGAFSLPDMTSDFRVAIVRGSIHPVIRHLKHHDDKMRTFVVVERLSHATELAELGGRVPFRVTVDYHLMKKDLSESFYTYHKDKGWIKEINPYFKKNNTPKK